jgi:hypothetical protein
MPDSDGVAVSIHGDLWVIPIGGEMGRRCFIALRNIVDI